MDKKAKRFVERTEAKIDDSVGENIEGKTNITNIISKWKDKLFGDSVIYLTLLTAFGYLISYRFNLGLRSFYKADLYTELKIDESIIIVVVILFTSSIFFLLIWFLCRWLIFGSIFYFLFFLGQITAYSKAVNTGDLPLIIFSNIFLHLYLIGFLPFLIRWDSRIRGFLNNGLDKLNNKKSNLINRIKSILWRYYKPFRIGIIVFCLFMSFIIIVIKLPVLTGQAFASWQDQYYVVINAEDTKIKEENDTRIVAEKYNNQLITIPVIKKKTENGKEAYYIKQNSDVILLDPKKVTLQRKELGRLRYE